MFALLALVCFVIALFEPALGPINMVTLGLAFIAAHLLFGGMVWSPANWRRPGQ